MYLDLLLNVFSLDLKFSYSIIVSYFGWGIVGVENPNGRGQDLRVLSENVALKYLKKFKRK